MEVETDPEKIAKFRKALRKPYQCPDCGAPIGGKLNPQTQRLEFCPHRKDSAKIPETNAKSRPWKPDVTLYLPKVTPPPWKPLEPKEWRCVAIASNDGFFDVVHFGSRSAITLTHLRILSPRYEKEEPRLITSRFPTLELAVEHGATLERVIKKQRGA